MIIDPAHRFALDYLVDNGRLSGWLTDHESDCVVVRWHDDDIYSVLDAQDRPLGWGETPEDALSAARITLTHRRRERDGITPAKVCP